MKTISPIQSWINGKSVTATIFNLYPIGGELFKYARFYYALLDENMGVCASGNLDMSGEAYQAWGNNDEYAYTWSASPEVLNLTIIGDYVPTTTTATTTEAPIETTTTTDAPTG